MERPQGPMTDEGISGTTEFRIKAHPNQISVTVRQNLPRYRCGLLTEPVQLPSGFVSFGPFDTI